MPSLNCFAAADQSITAGDGELRWEVVKTYYSSGSPVGVQTNAITWASDTTGAPASMTIDQEAWFNGSQSYSSFDSFVPGGGGITWRVDMESPQDFFAGSYDSSATTSTITWANHFATQSATATTSDPDINPHTVWLDWQKSGHNVIPRITFGASPPNNFNKWLANGQHNPN